MASTKDAEASGDFRKRRGAKSAKTMAAPKCIQPLARGLPSALVGGASSPPRLRFWSSGVCASSTVRLIRVCEPCSSFGEPHNGLTSCLRLEGIKDALVNCSYQFVEIRHTSSLADLSHLRRPRRFRSHNLPLYECFPRPSAVRHRD